MALFKIFNNFNDLTKTIDNVSNHKAGYCYFDATTNKFYVDTVDNQASGLHQLNGTFYGECSTAGNVAIKTAAISGFALAKGVSVYIKFQYTNTAAPPLLKLNISNTGEVFIKQYGITSLDDSTTITAGSILNFVYDGTNWIWVGSATVTSSGGGGATTGRLTFGNGTYVFDGSEDVTVPLYTGEGTWTGGSSSGSGESGSGSETNEENELSSENNEVITDENGNIIELDGGSSQLQLYVSSENNEIITDESENIIKFDESNSNS